MSTIMKKKNSIILVFIGKNKNSKYLDMSEEEKQSEIERL